MQEELVELVGVYPEKNMGKSVVGTFHFFLIKEKMDVRGGRILHTKGGKLFVQMPQARGTNEETGEPIFFPVINFLDDEYNKKIRFEVVGKVMKEWTNKKKRVAPIKKKY